MELLKNPLPKFPCALRKPLHLYDNYHNIDEDVKILEIIIIFTHSGGRHYYSISKSDAKYIYTKHYFSKDSSYRILYAHNDYNKVNEYINNGIKSSTYNTITDRIKL